MVKNGNFIPKWEVNDLKNKIFVTPKVISYNNGGHL